LEALRPAEQGRRLRGILRHFGGNELHGSSHPDIRLDRGERLCLSGGRAIAFDLIIGSTRPIFMRTLIQDIFPVLKLIILPKHGYLSILP
jgi:hypothetical protein